MRNLHRILALSGICLLLATASAWAQPTGSGPGMGGRGPGGGMGMGRGMQYDPQTVETVSGEVTQVQQMPGRAAGVHLQVKTDKETITVILGTASYLEQQPVKVAVGDKVEIKGSRVQRPSRTLLIAAELKKGDQVLKLRDDQGNPLWPRRGLRR